VIAAVVAATALACASASPARFVQLRLSVVAYGVQGSGTIALDLRTGRFARRFDDGPASESEGFDGRRAWRADATGMSRVQGNAGERNEIVAWSSALMRAMQNTHKHAVLKGATDSVDVVFDHYERRDGCTVPGRIVARSAQNGAWTATLRDVAVPPSLSPSVFEPPSPPRDFALSGVTRLPVSMEIGSPVIDVRVDGVALHFLLDTGGQNVITTRAAARVGLRVVGRGVVNGGGGGSAAIRYAFADTVRVGTAEMRHQPFIVLSPDALPPVDGIVGYELLARFAARLDMAHGTLELARRASAFGRAEHPARFAYFDRQPQIGGSLDGIVGAFSVDTGSSLNAQVQAPFVQEHDLVTRLRASVRTYANDVGGRYPIYLVRVSDLRLGNATVQDPVLNLLTRASSSNNATLVANVGDGLLRRWIIVLDYAGQTIDLRSGGDADAGTVVHDRSGILLQEHSGAVIVRLVLSGTPASEAGIREGARIEAVDGSRCTPATRLVSARCFPGRPAPP
jgi:hypothetical protein